MTCRGCLSTNVEIRDLSLILDMNGKHLSLADLLQLCFEYKTSPHDGLTQKLCMVCITQLTAAYSFKSLIEHSLEKLMTYSVAPHFDDSYDYSDRDCTETLHEHSLPEADYNVKKEPTPYYADLSGNMTKPTNNSIPDLAAPIEDPTPSAPPQTQLVLPEAPDKQFKRTMYCVKCKMKFNSALQLFKHCLKEHKPEQTVGRPCNYCNERLDDFRALIIHNKLHKSPYLCEVCWTGFSSETKLNQHICRKYHTLAKENDTRTEADNLMRQCDQCGKSYPRGYIKVHMLVHGDKTYACKYCPKTFKLPCSLNSHVQWNHKRERNHKCPYNCGAMFITSSSRSTHIRKQHLKEKKHQCSSCGKQFFSHSELKRHTLTHTGAKNYHCQACSKSYQTRYGLNVHLRTHNLENSLLQNKTPP